MQNVAHSTTLVAGYVTVGNLKASSREIRIYAKSDQSSSRDTHSTQESSSFTKRRAVLGASIALSGAVGLSAGRADAVPLCGVYPTKEIPGWAYGQNVEFLSLPYRDYKLLIKKHNDLFKKTVFGGQKRVKQPAALLVGGGPSGGWSSRLLESMEELGRENIRPVITYDMTGGGESLLLSGAAPKPEDINMEFYADEMLHVIKEMDMRYFHVVGLGIGGMIVLEALRRGLADRDDILSYTFCSTSGSYASLIADRQAKLEALPPEVRDRLLAEEGTPRNQHSQAYTEAFETYSCKHVVQNTDAICAAQASAQQGLTLSRVLTGNCYFTEAGSLAGWQADPEALAKVKSPVMYIRGLDEEPSEASMTALLGLFANAPTDYRIVRPSGSYPPLDAHNAYIERQEKFWKSLDILVPKDDSVYTPPGSKT